MRENVNNVEWKHVLFPPNSVEVNHVCTLKQGIAFSSSSLQMHFLSCLVASLPLGTDCCQPLKPWEGSGWLSQAPKHAMSKSCTRCTRGKQKTKVDNMQNNVNTSQQTQCHFELSVAKLEYSNSVNWCQLDTALAPRFWALPVLPVCCAFDESHSINVQVRSQPFCCILYKLGKNKDTNRSVCLVPRCWEVCLLCHFFYCHHKQCW